MPAHWMPWFLLMCASLATASPPQVEPTLPGTQPLLWPESQDAEMADRLMDGAHRFVDRQMATAITRRERHWNRDVSKGPAAYEASVASNRQAFRRLIGVVDELAEPVMQRFEDDLNPARVAETSAYTVYQVRWEVLTTPGTGGGVWGEGLLVEPRGDAAGYAVVVPDADQTPEQTMGLAEGIKSESRTARRLAEAGFTLVIPTLVNRQRLDASQMQVGPEAMRRLARQDQTHREWLYRQAYHMGRHVIGYEVQKVLSAVAWLKRRAGPEANVGVTGYGEGGLIAFYAAAADPAIDAVLVSGYFDSREDTWTEPVYRNVWALLDQFGDAEIATLIAPRGLVVEHSPVSSITDHKGEIRTSEFESVRDEFERIDSLVPRDFHTRTLVYGENGEPVGPGSTEALRTFASMLGVDAGRLDLDRGMSDELLGDRRAAFEPDARHLRQVLQIQGHVQMLVRTSVHVRNAFFGHALLPKLTDFTWSTEPVHETLEPGPFIEASRPYRDEFDREVQGRFDEELLPPNPRTRLSYEEENWVGYDVVLDVFEDLVAWGALMLPRDLEPGERRPVVVVQHGRNSVPEYLIAEDRPAYGRAPVKLAERGFIVFVPHNLYRNESRYRPLKANTVKATLYSFLVHQHDQILRWLTTLDYVDGERIGFYGLSFGGETALRVPPILEGYALSISSAYFNQWARKVAGTGDPFNYLFSDEWEVPVFNAGHTFDHAELAYLMVPRPFMVERGHYDHVADDRWVAHEYARVRRLYALLGLEDRTAIEYFQGGHSMRLDGALEFLHEHLRWPPPNESP